MGIQEQKPMANVEIPQEQPVFNMEELTGKYVEFSTTPTRYVFTGWRVKQKQTGKVNPETGEDEIKPALFMQCLSIDGKSCSKFVEVSSIRFNKLVQPIIEKAIRNKRGEIKIVVQKILGTNKEGLPDQSKNSYIITEW
jgi:hypothetical protein